MQRCRAGGRRRGQHPGRLVAVWKRPGRDDRGSVVRLGPASCRLSAPKRRLQPKRERGAAQALPWRCFQLSKRCGATSAGPGLERRRCSAGRASVKGCLRARPRAEMDVLLAMSALGRLPRLLVHGRPPQHGRAWRSRGREAPASASSDGLGWGRALEAAQDAAQGERALLGRRSMPLAAAGALARQPGRRTGCSLQQSMSSSGAGRTSPSLASRRHVGLAGGWSLQQGEERMQMDVQQRLGAQRSFARPAAARGGAAAGWGVRRGALPRLQLQLAGASMQCLSLSADLCPAPPCACSSTPTTSLRCERTAVQKLLPAGCAA